MKLNFDFITNPAHRAKLESFDFDEEIAERFLRETMNCTAPDGNFPLVHVTFTYDENDNNRVVDYIIVPLDGALRGSIGTGGNAKCS
jgi:hypothetical protein